MFRNCVSRRNSSLARPVPSDQTTPGKSIESTDRHSNIVAMVLEGVVIIQSWAGVLACLHSVMATSPSSSPDHSRFC